MGGATLTAPRHTTPGMNAMQVDPYPTLLRAALLVAVVPGVGLGLFLMLGLVFQWPIAGWLPLAQAHGHAQVFGFTALFVLGVGTKLFPSFLSTQLAHPRRMQLAGVMIGLGVGMRFLLQPLPVGELRGVGLMLAAALELVGCVMFATAFRRTCAASIQPHAIWQDAGMLAFVSLLLGYMLNLVVSVELASGAAVVGPALDEAAVHLGIYGFVVPITLGVGLKIFPQFLILRPSRAVLFRPALATYALGTGLVVLGWLVQARLPEWLEWAGWLRLAGWLATAAGLSVYLAALRLFEPGARPSGMPHITYPTRRWFRLATLWLAAAVLMGLAFAVREVSGGGPANLLEASAQRHAVAMGYLLPLLVGMAGRILPRFSGAMTRQPRVLEAMVWLLLAGAALRVSGQLFWGYSGLGAILTPIGGVLALLGFAWFTWLLWPTLGRPITATTNGQTMGGRSTGGTPSAPTSRPA